MIFTVDMWQEPPINFAPTLAEEVEQNIRTILSTPAGSAPFARDIGIPTEVLDEPIPIAKARLTGLIISSLTVQEPRTQIEEVTFFEDASAGRLVPVIRYTIKEGST
ncbi:GPW/gp25 family protein [Paenibacillus sp. FJAT-26967]|uniref:GPW/gp25 family protein n=1 Tax=Paenibacillus sp. FJAT-26967 TaxID=1729690 RepID=UPI0008382873|nr:GPW/gp25 family protein [Paenibacillus sp. FJAT-26967]